jgi:hypothetical protein
LGGATIGETVFTCLYRKHDQELNLYGSFQTYRRLKFVKSWPQGSGGATIGETDFTYVYIENMFQKSSEQEPVCQKNLNLYESLIT